MMNCKYLLELYKHPWNKELFNGDISESSGLYCCTVLTNLKGSENKGIIFTEKNCSCELYKKRK